MHFSEKVRKRLAMVQVGLLGLGVFALVPGIDTVKAAAPGAVVINEVAWAGSADSANDEWIELYNTTGAAVDLAGWKLKDDGVVAFTFPAGATIAANGYALIEDSEAAVANVTADFIYNMSLANAGDALQLIDGSAAIIDTVNGSGGAWYFGSSGTYATMERKDPLQGDLPGNFATSTGGSGALGSAGSPIKGTPRALNSVSTAPLSQSGIKAEFTSAAAQIGQTVTMQVKADNVSDLFAYGFTLNYDSTLLALQNVTAGPFLSNTQTVSTSFQSGLKAGQAGQLLVAEARTIDPKAGRSGSGLLFEVNFKVLAGEGQKANVTFAADSFVASPSGDMSMTLSPGSLDIGSATIEPVTVLQATTGSSRYQIKLSWTASASSPDHYRVERMDAHGQWAVLAGVTGTEFTDQDEVSGGGFIIPNLVYHYRVTAVKGTITSTAVEIAAQDSRGIKGDNNRSDLVDGRDLERLARHFAENDQASGFDALIDTTYDGQVNGSDLIDLGAAFASAYK